MSTEPLPDRLAGVLARISDAQAITRHLQRDYMAEREARKEAARISAYHAYRERNPLVRRGPEPLDKKAALKIAIRRIKEEVVECPYCAAPIEKGKAVIDHFIPLTKGGKHEADNLVGCCRSCNSKKGSKIDWPPALAWKARQTPVVEVEFD